MCGRSRIGSLTVEAISKIDPTFKISPIENVQPGFEVPIVFPSGQHKKYQVRFMTWGLIPHFMDRTSIDHFIMFNAKQETIFEKPSYKKLIHSKRCVVYFDGFYEWKQENKGYKQPYYITNNKFTEPLALAAIYDVNLKGTEPLYTFSILTSNSGDDLKHIHTRQPVFLNTELIQQWLDISMNPHELLKQYHTQEVNIIPVTPRMNKIIYQEPDCSVEIDISSVHDVTIQKYFSPHKEKDSTIHTSTPPVSSSCSSTKKRVEREESHSSASKPRSKRQKLNVSSSAQKKINTYFAPVPKS
jgi:putative SOS response-associated peptidase YedK